MRGLGPALVVAFVLLALLMQSPPLWFPSGSSPWERWIYAALYLLICFCLVAVFLSFFLPGNRRDKLMFVGLSAITGPSIALFVVAWVSRPGFVLPVVGAAVVAVVVWAWKR